MKVVAKPFKHKNNLVQLKYLFVGIVFESTDGYYIKINDITEYNAVELQTGSLVYFDPEENVRPIDGQFEED